VGVEVSFSVDLGEVARTAGERVALEAGFSRGGVGLSEGGGGLATEGQMDMGALGVRSLGSFGL